MPWPMPDVEPVTTAVFPLSDMITSHGKGSGRATILPQQPNLEHARFVHDAAARRALQFV
jgi:hypothetical protein